MDVPVTALASTCPPGTLFYHFVICNYPAPPAAAGSQTRLSVTSNNSWRGGRVRTGAAVSHNARANSQTLILGIKLLSGWHGMTRQSEAMRPLNFSPPNLQKNVWNDISTYQNKGRAREEAGGGGERREGKTEGVLWNHAGPTVADKDETSAAVGESGRRRSSDRHGDQIRGC